MHKTKTIAYLILAVAMLAGLACTAEPPAAEPAEEETAAATEPERVSPHESTAATVGEANITITYGRPYKKGREIYGGLVPFAEVWRTGADEATTLESDRDLMLGDLHVPAGTYGLFTIPGESSWTLIVNKVADQWGAFSYDESEDLGREEMSVSATDAEVEQLTISVEPGEGSNATLSIVWDMTSATLPIMAH
ncbi:MAG: DUF2911 domain-containing protein [Bryobacterales bacterium]|nr:DUF2911 domain-containing protein [Bryobacterales bacterium]